MRFNELKLYEWVISSADFTMPDFSEGKLIGKISTAIGNLDLYSRVEDGVLGIAAVDPNIGKQTPLGYVGFQKINSTWYITKNAFTEKAYKRNGIISEILKFAASNVGISFLSDTHMSNDGVELWHSLIRSNKFNFKILYVPTVELFDLNEIGSSTADDEIVILPDNDLKSENFYNSSTKEGQRFFYAVIGDDLTINEGFVPVNGYGQPSGLSDLIQRYRNFDKGSF